MGLSREVQPARLMRMERARRVASTAPVLWFSAAYVLVATIVALASGNSEFIFYIVVMLCLAAAVVAVHRRVGLSQGLLWCLALWGMLHMMGGLLPVPETSLIGGPVRVLYSLWLVPGYLKYDQLVHAYGFGVTTWLFWQALTVVFLEITGEAPRPSPGLLTLCAAAGMGLGAFNEVVEFVATLTMEQTNVGGYANTGWDLVFNLFGCVAAALIIRLKVHRRKQDQVAL